MTMLEIRIAIVGAIATNLDRLGNALSSAGELIWVCLAADAAEELYRRRK
jgi:hypothetical protein